jgi:hypothetical protein
VADPDGGAPVRLIRAPGPDGPWPVPVDVSCRGLRAQAPARTAGDGATTGVLSPGGVGLVRERVGPDIPLLEHAVGIVRDPDEAWHSPRLRAAVGPVVAVAFRQCAEQPWRQEGLDPGLHVRAAAYLERVDRDRPPVRRHLDLHRGHLVGIELDADRERVTPGHIRRVSMTATTDELAAHIHGPAADGMTELAVQPGGDVADELLRLASAPRPAGLLRSPDGS